MPLGSSPHTRGARPCAYSFRLYIRDHPRIRGEHLDLLLVRGQVVGIIPAYAGSTVQDSLGHAGRLGSSPHTRGARSTHGASVIPSRDHPRIRGEHRLALCFGLCFSGIIPAYAGSTHALTPFVSIYKGSSPHTRGAQLRYCVNVHDLRDHPRIRGEHTCLPAIPIPGVAVLYHFIQSDGPCASCLHRSSLTSWLHSSSHLRNRSASPSKPNHRNPWASSWIDEHEMQHVAHYWPNRPLSPCHH